MPIFEPRSIGTSGGLTEKFKTAQEATYQSAPTTTQWGDLVSLALGPGEWDLTALVSWNHNSSSGNTYQDIGISTTSGNSATGLTEGINRASSATALSSVNASTQQISDYRVKISATTTYYLKGRVDFSAGTPQWRGSLIAVRRGV